MAMSKVKSSKPIRPQYSNCMNYAALSAEEQKLRPPGSSPHSSAVPSKKVEYRVCCAINCKSTCKIVPPYHYYYSYMALNKFLWSICEVER